MVKTMTVVGTTSMQSLVSFCEEIVVDPMAVLTEEVKGKASNLTSLTTVAERFSTYGGESVRTSSPVPSAGKVEAWSVDNLL